jgi:protein TonB
MEIKKKPQADVNRISQPSFMLGLAVALAIVVAAFEWKTVIIEPLVEEDGLMNGIELDDPIVTKIPPPRPPKPIVAPEQIKEADDLEDIENPELTIEVPEPEEPLIDFIPAPEPEPDPDVYFSVVEKMPEPVMGMQAFYAFLSENMRYPRLARKMNIEGRVYVQFIVNTDGSLSDITVVKGIGGGCDEEAIRVMKMSPRWTPGKQRGRPVRVQMVVPIYFRLN